MDSVAALPIVCPSGTTCTNGACTTVQTTAPYCYDNTVGDDVTRSGTTTYGVYDTNTNLDLTATNVVDMCVNTNTVRKYYCASGSATSASYTDVTCPVNTNCVNGACVTTLVSFCTDSDNGENVAVKGNTRQGTRNPTTGVETIASNLNDACVNTNTVRDYICASQSSATFVDRSCPSGQTCNDGACIFAGVPTELFCTDSDNGETTSTKGTTRSGTRNPSTLAEISATQDIDSCVNQNTVREYICSANTRTFVDRSCASGFTCNDGACVVVATPTVEPYCTDSDGGDNLQSRGIVASGTRNPTTLVIITRQNDLEDTCVSSTVVREHTCNSIPVGVGADRACPSGQVCSDGRCLVPAATSEAFCRDDDGGEVLNTRGTTRSGTRNPTTLVEISAAQDTDSCVNQNTVREYLCSANARTSVDRSCVSGTVCFDGRCIASAPQAFCSENDSGDNIFAKGTTRQGTRDPLTLVETGVSSEIDSCYNATTVREYVCDTNARSTLLHNCPSGLVCSDGVCINSPTTTTSCSDPDGTNYRVVGTTTVEVRDQASRIVSTTVNQDSCVTSNRIREYYCSNALQATIETDCAQGETCQSGRCIVSGTATCTDTDNGIIARTKGTVTVTRNGATVSTATDECVDDRKVKELYCLNGGETATVTQCDGNEICRSGACVTRPISVERTHTITLTKGWNLFSIPFDSARVVSTCPRFSTTRRPWHYDSTTKNWVRVLVLEGGKGYWLKATDTCTITATGTENVEARQTLSAGWNQVGASFDVESLSPMLTSCTVTNGPWAYDTVQKQYVRATETERGNGYFVKVSATCTMQR